MPESWALDGVTLTAGAFSLLELSADPPRARMDWISSADSESAALFRQPLHENRTITMKLRVTPQATMDAALDQVGALVDKLRKASATVDGIALVWTPADSTRARTFDVIAGEMTGIPISLSGDGFSWVLRSPIVTVELTCKPYGRGPEVLTSTASSSTPFVVMDVPSVTGDVPALGRLIVTDTASQSRRHVEWGIEGQYYNNATSLLLDSDNLVTSGFAGTQTVATAAYDPNATGNNAVTATLTTQPIAVCGTGNQSHVGVYRVKARVYSDSKIWVRLAWQAGDGPLSTNAYVNQPAIGFWSEVDLGTITVPVALVGTQRWTGRIEAFALTSGPIMFVDYLTLIPVAEGYGKARASYAYATGVVVGQDAFIGTTSGNALDTRVAPSGGTWATSGDTGDFLFRDTWYGVVNDIENVGRATFVVETTGRLGILGSTNYTDTQADVRVYSPALGSDDDQSLQGLIVRYVDASNYIRLTVPVFHAGVAATVKLEQVVAGAVTTLASSSWQRAARTSYRLRLLAFASGRVIAQVLSDAGGILVELQASSSAVATAGALQTGKPGIYDRSLTTTSLIRRWTEFSVSTPSAEPIVVYSGRNMQIRYDDTVRQDSTGTYTGRPQSYRGSRFLVPVGTSRVIVKARRNDIDAAPDDNVVDATQIQVGWTPRFLAVPRA